MRTILSSEEIDIPEGVTVETKGKTVTVAGPLGTLKRNFGHVTCDINKKIVKNKSKVGIDIWFAKKKQKASVNTVSSHIKNMITGVTDGYVYKMRLAYSHFPIQITVQNSGKTMEVKHFLGEQMVRRIDALEGVSFIKTEEQKDDFLVQGTDLENVSLTCALLHQCVKIRHKDIRQFLDGIYVSDKRMPMKK